METPIASASLATCIGLRDPRFDKKKRRKVFFPAQIAIR